MTREFPGRRGAPRPPRELEEQMGAAGAAGDDALLGLLHDQYETWLEQHGYQRPHRGRPARADKAAQ